MPAVFALPLGADVAAAFARGFWARAGADPLRVARMLVVVNTPRTARALEDALAEAAPGSALLPRIRGVESLGQDPALSPGEPPAIAPLRRQFRLIRLVEGYLAASEGPGASQARAVGLAQSLATLLDELDEAVVSVGAVGAAALETLEGEAPAAHWQAHLAFLDLVRRVWPEIRRTEEAGAPDPKARQSAAVRAQIAAWRAAPPAAPVLAVGSTGAVASTAELLGAIARLPQGAVVLPGLDRGLGPDLWRVVAAGAAPEHPQAPFARLLGALGRTPSEVPAWDPEAPEPDGPGGPARARLLREVFRPAPVTDGWVAAAPALAAEDGGALSGVTLVEAPTARLEAGAIALAIREGLDRPGLRIALVTPDAQLARRVTAELGPLGVLPDDSLGRPLSSSPPAVFLRLVAEAAAAPEPVGLASLLQHPLMRAGLSRGAHLAEARAYERAVLRARETGAPQKIPPWPGATEAGAAWLGRVRGALEPLAQGVRDRAPLSALLAAHVAAAEALSQEGEGPPEIWTGAAGQALAARLAHIQAEAGAYGAGPVPAYRSLLTQLVGAEEIRPDPAAPHPRVAILGPREARAQPADLVILGGLVEDVWPALPGEDPWLSRPMRAALGLPAPEARIGLSAHDAWHAMARREVILTRAARRDGAPVRPSRWLVRLESLLGGVGEGRGLAEIRGRGARLLARAEALHRPAEAQAPAPRPRPVPPAEARPRRLSVTEIEGLVADPYGVYVKRVLGLKALDPLGRPADALDRGEALHAVFQRFVEATAETWPGEAAAAARLAEAAETELAARIPWPDLRRLWRGRVARIAGWFLAREVLRREIGAPLALERKGQIRLPTEAGAVEIVARADRIDRLANGAAIYDYKAGSPPSDRQIKAGRNQQLLIQAAMLARGGFDDLPPLAPQKGAYIGLSGQERGVTVSTEAAEAHMARVADLVAHFLGGAPFLARARPDLAYDAADTDHLARRAEWDPSA